MAVSRNKFRRPFFVAVIVVFALLAYAWQIEPRRIGVTRLRLPDALARALGNERVVYIADLHVMRGWIQERPLLATLAALDPDYLLVGGDLVWYEGDVDRTLELLKRLHARKGVFAVLGDSDYNGRVRNCAYCHVPETRELRHDLPVRVLRNEAVELAGGKVRLVGLDVEERGGWAPTVDRWLDGREPTIVLTHFPYALPVIASRGADLVLAADTHGGQIAAPRWMIRLLFGPLREHFLYGWFHERSTPMFVTRGIGESIVPLRFGRPPEVVLFTGGN
jgi:hypothetical protein